MAGLQMPWFVDARDTTACAPAFVTTVIEYVVELDNDSSGVGAESRSREVEATPGNLRQPETARLATTSGLVIMTAASMRTTEGRHP